MRITLPRFQINYYRHTKRIWKREGRLQAEELRIPPVLAAMGVPIIDAKEILQETKIFKDPKIINKPAVPILPSLFEVVKCSYVMHYKTKVSENENQTLSLTKTLAFQGLPNQISSLVGCIGLPNQDDLVKTSILQAQIWAADQDKLPKVINVLRPGKRYRREYGIRSKKIVSGTLEKLTNLCDLATGKYPTSILRSTFVDNFADVTVLRNNDTVTFKSPCDKLLTHPEPLKRFASVSEVDSTEEAPVPNIYPIKHTLDLDKVEEAPATFGPGCVGKGHIHTIFVSQKSFGFWFPHQLLARAIAACFTFSAVKAQELYGVNVAVLPEPVCIQCVYHDAKSFNFMAYQLNTLDLEHNEGVKNQIWIDEPLDIYSSISDETGIKDYNPEVFRKLLALYLNGLSPDQA